MHSAKLYATEHKAKTNYEKFINYAEHYHDSTAFYLDAFKSSMHKYLLESNTKAVPVIKTWAKEFGGLSVSESKDKKMIVVSWDDQTGGTMRNFDGIFCYKRGKEYVTENIYEKTDEFEINANVYEMHQVVDQKGSSIYVLFEYVKASSGLFGYTIRTVTLKDGQLNRGAKYIKTTTRLKNTIDYGIDWTESANRNNPTERHLQVPSFEQATQTISIPVIWEDGKLTKNRIKYRFNGDFFEREFK